MLHYAAVFFHYRDRRAIFAFGGIAAGAAGIAKVLFVLFLIGAVISLVLGRPWPRPLHSTFKGGAIHGNCSQ